MVIPSLASITLGRMGHPLLLASGKLVRVDMGHVAQPHLFQKIVGDGLGFLPGKVAPGATEINAISGAIRAPKSSTG